MAILWQNEIAAHSILKDANPLDWCSLRPALALFHEFENKNQAILPRNEKRKYEFKFFQKFHSKKFDKNVMIRKLSTTDIYARSCYILAKWKEMH